MDQNKKYISKEFGNVKPEWQDVDKHAKIEVENVKPQKHPIKTTKKLTQEIKNTTIKVAEMQQMQTAAITYKKIPNANDFDVLSISEMRAQEAAEERAKLAQTVRKQGLETSGAAINATVTATFSTHLVKQFLPDVSKDFKKMKMLDSNLERIQKMRASFDPTDDICEELFKMEKLFEQEKKFILQKYAKSANVLLPPPMHTVPKAAKKTKKEIAPSIIVAKTATISVTTQPTLIPISSQTKVNSVEEFDCRELKNISPIQVLGIKQTVAKETIVDGELETKTKAEQMKKVDLDSYILNSNRETIKMTIAPIKLPHKSNAFQMSCKRPALLQIWNDDDDDDVNVNNVNDEQKNQSKNTASTTTEALKEAVRAEVEKVTRPMKSGETNKCMAEHKEYTLTRGRSHRSDNSTKHTRRSRSHSSSRRSRQSSQRRYQNSFSRSRSSSRSRSWQRRGNNSTMQRRGGSAYRRKSQFSGKNRAYSVTPPRPKRPRTPISTPPPSATRSHASSPNYHYRQRDYSCSRSRSPSPHIFKPPSPPIEHGESPHSIYELNSNSRSWSRERHINRGNRFRTRARTSHRRSHSPRSPCEYVSPIYTQQDNMVIYDQGNYEHYRFEDRQFYTNLEDYQCSTVENMNDAYYYNMPTQMHQPFENVSTHNYMDAGTNMPTPYENYMHEQFFDPRYLTEEHTEKEMFTHINNLCETEAPSQPFASYPTTPQPITNVNQSVLKELTKATTVAVQKGNVLVIVPTDATNQMKHVSGMSAQIEDTHDEMKENDVVNIKKPLAPHNSHILQFNHNKGTPLLHKDQTQISGKKTIDMKRQDEVERRETLVALSQRSPRKSILKCNNSEKTELLTKKPKQSVREKLSKKKVFFKDGIYPGQDSEEEDRKAVQELLVLKVKHLRKRFGENLAIVRLMAAELDDEDIEPELYNLPPPPPPPDMPLSNIEQPIYMRPTSPDIFVFFHYDADVGSMFVSPHEHALPPRFLEQKKAMRPTGVEGATMTLFTNANQAHIDIQPMQPPTLFNTRLPLAPSTPPMHVTMPPPDPTHPPSTRGIRPTIRSTERNELITQPLYPTFVPIMANPQPYKNLQTPK